MRPPRLVTRSQVQEPHREAPGKHRRTGDIFVQPRPRYSRSTSTHHGIRPDVAAGYQDNFSEESRPYIDSIIRAIQKLDSLTKDMLAYTQVTRERVSMSNVNVASVVRDIIASNPRLSEPGIVDIHPLPIVLGERVLLDQALRNLLDNALKFVPAGTSPRIIVRAEAVEMNPGASDEKAMSTVRIWVEDNGVGIAPKYHERIFNIFERLNTTNHGTGIGLAIVAKAVAKMGGKVGVESEPEKGSRFWIELQKT